MYRNPGFAWGFIVAWFLVSFFLYKTVSYVDSLVPDASTLSPKQLKVLERQYLKQQRRKRK
jgi:hypothetical protein